MLHAGSPGAWGAAPKNNESIRDPEKCEDGNSAVCWIGLLVLQRNQVLSRWNCKSCTEPAQLPISRLK